MKFATLLTPSSVNMSRTPFSKKVREKSRECHNHKPQSFPDPKRKRKPTNLNKHKQNKRTKSTKISSLFPKRGNRNTKRTEKHKNKMTHGKTYNKSPRRINHKATKSKTNKDSTMGPMIPKEMKYNQHYGKVPIYFNSKLSVRPYVFINSFTISPNNSFNEGWEIYLYILASSVRLSFRPFVRPYKSMSCLFVLRFVGPVNPTGSCRARSVYLTTHLLGRLSPLSG